MTTIVMVMVTMMMMMMMMEEEEDVHLGGSARGAEDLELVANLQRQPLLLLQEYNHHHY